MVATKKPAKTSAKIPLAADKPAVLVELTRHVCAHCGVGIPVNKVIAVQRTWFDANNKQKKSKIFFTVGHPQVEKD